MRGDERRGKKVERKDEDDDQQKAIMKRKIGRISNRRVHCVIPKSSCSKASATAPRDLM